MGAIRKDRFVKELTKDPEDRGVQVGGYGGGYTFKSPLKQALYQSQMIPNSALIGVTINEESAVKIYDQLREYVAVRGYYPGKYLRPWEIDPELYSDLDENQPWWGFEFETGYLDNDKRAEIVRRTWNELNNTCFDAEGEGQARCEITFAPQELSKYEDRTAEACKFMRLIDEMRDTHVQKTDAVAVGCHLNVSVPGLGKENYAAVTAIMNNTLTAMPTYFGKDNSRNVRQEFFGRAQLYGLFYGHASPNYDQRGNIIPDMKQYYWLEGKLFRTSYHYARFEQYLAVCDALTRCMQWLVKQDPKVLNRLVNRSQLRAQPAPNAVFDENTYQYSELAVIKGNGAYFKNFVEMVLEGAEPEIASWHDGEEASEDGTGCLVKAFRKKEAEAVEDAGATPAAVEAA